ncbi:MAG: PPC domain-containing protein [Anaerolineae bacterium]
MSRRLFLFIAVLLVGCQAINPPPTSLTLPIRLIAFWETASGTLQSADEAQPFQFAAQAGDGIRVQVTGSNPVNITLQSPDGTTLVQGVDKVEAALPTSGAYTVLLTVGAATQYDIELGYTDRLNPADFTATPTPTRVVTPTPTPPYYARLGTLIGEVAGGQNRRGEFVRPEDRHVYTLNGRSGDYITVEVAQVTGTVDPVVHFYGPDGSELAADDDSGGGSSARLRNVRLAQDGLYSFQVWGHGFSGEYHIDLAVSLSPIPITTQAARLPTATATPQEPLIPTIQAAVSGQPLEDHVPLLGSLERAGDFDRYSFKVVQGQLITVGVRADANSALQPRLELYDPEGSLIYTATVANSNAEGDVLIPSLLAAQNGDYVVFISGERNTSGAYIVSYGVGFSHEDVRRGITVSDQVYTNEILRRGQSELWSLDLAQDDIISAAASPLSVILDPYLELIAPDGTIISTDDNSGGGRDAFIASARAPISGRYRLRLSAARAAADGQYTLVWRIINRAPTATPAPGTVLLMSYQDIMPENVYQFYPFYGEAGARVSIRVRAESGSTLDPVAVLLAPDGSEIAAGDDGANDLNPNFTASLPASGTYQVRVNGYLSRGAFTVTVEQVFG